MRCYCWGMGSGSRIVAVCHLEWKSLLFVPNTRTQFCLHSLTRQWPPLLALGYAVGILLGLVYLREHTHTHTHTHIQTHIYGKVNKNEISLLNPLSVFQFIKCSTYFSHLARFTKNLLFLHIYIYIYIYVCVCMCVCVCVCACMFMGVNNGNEFDNVEKN